MNGRSEPESERECFWLKKSRRREEEESPRVPRRRGGEGFSIRRRVADPELNDYPNPDVNKRPQRTYDNDGLLVLKGAHQQINPVVKPTVPKLPTPPLRFPHSPDSCSRLSRHSMIP